MKHLLKFKNKFTKHYLFKFKDGFIGRAAVSRAGDDKFFSCLGQLKSSSICWRLSCDLVLAVLLAVSCRKNTASENLSWIISSFQPDLALTVAVHLIESSKACMHYEVSN